MGQLLCDLLVKSLPLISMNGGRWAGMKSMSHSTHCVCLMHVPCVWKLNHCRHRCPHTTKALLKNFSAFQWAHKICLVFSSTMNGIHMTYSAVFYRKFFPMLIFAMCFLVFIVYRVYMFFAGPLIMQHAYAERLCTITSNFQRKNYSLCSRAKLCAACMNNEGVLL